MRLLISFAALFLSVVLLQLSSGALGPLDALTGLSLNFSNAQVGLLGSAHFFGFFIGCWWAPRLMGSIGHSRAFAAFTSLGAVGLLSHTLFIDPTGWALMRVASGVCIAGSYTVVEAWMQAKVTNESRGRAMGIYRIVDMGGSLCAQLTIGFLANVEFYVAYNLLALLCCASLLPLVLTRVSQPKTPSAPRLRPHLAWIRSPLAVASVVVAGLTGAAFRMVGPIYGQDVGLAPEQIGLFLASFVAGGALAQYPAGWLADKYDRRWVLIWFSIASLASSAITVATSSSGTAGVMLAAAFFGAMTFPIYSVAAAHAHDFAEDHERVELSAALMFFYALGAIASPLVTSQLVESFGPSALFIFLGCSHLALAIYGFARMSVRPTKTDRTAYAYIPRTSFTIGRLIRRKRSGANKD